MLTMAIQKLKSAGSFGMGPYMALSRFNLWTIHGAAPR